MRCERNPVANAAEAHTCLSGETPLPRPAISQSDELRSGFCQANRHTVMYNLGRTNHKQYLQEVT